MKSRAHNLRNRRYKEWILKFAGTFHEESEEAVVLMTDRKSNPVKREGPLNHVKREGK